MPYRELAEIPSEPPPSVPAFLLEKRQRRRRLLGLLGAAIPLSACAIWSIGQLVEQQQRRRAAEAVAAARECVLGPVPLGDAESAEMRFRRRQLNAVNEPSGDSEPWPGRCVSQLHDAAARQHGDPLDPYGRLAVALGQRDAVIADLSPAIDGAARAFARDAPTEWGPPPARLLDVDGLSDDSRLVGGTGRGAFEDNPSGPLRGLFGQLFCTFDASAPRAECRNLSAPLLGGGRLPATTEVPDAALVVSMGSDPFREQGDVTATWDRLDDTRGGTPVTKQFFLGGVARADGTHVALGYTCAHADCNERTFWLHATSRGLVPLAGPPVHNAQIFWNELYVRTVEGDGERVRVTALEDALQAAPRYRDVLGPVPLAFRGDVQPGLSACRTSAITAVTFAGQLVFRRADGTFSKPQSVPVGHLDCYDQTATLTHVTSGAEPVVHHTRCTESGCEQFWIGSDLARTAFAPLSLRAGDLQAVPVGARLLVVWRGESPTGLRLRLAAPERLGTAADQVVFDDYVRGGKLALEGTLFDFSLRSAGTAGALFLRTASGIHALRIEPDGAVTPWPVHLQPR